MVFLVAALLLLVPTNVQAQSARLSLPVASPAGVSSFEVPAPTGSLLSGLLIPSTGPLTAWAPVWADLQGDGDIKESSTGGWTGPRPPQWLKVVKPGHVVGGFRFLVRTGPGSVQVRQVQVFWKPWADGTAKGETVTSRVYGLAAGADDEVRIVELRMPEGAVPTGLWGEVSGGAVVQVSLVVRQPEAVPATPSRAQESLKAPSTIRGPTLPQVPVAGPLPPVAPRVP